MIKINKKSETISGVFGVESQRGDELTDLLQAAGNAYVHQLIQSTGAIIALDKAAIVELFTTYAENDSEFAFCIFHAGQASTTLENYLNNNFTKTTQR